MAQAELLEQGDLYFLYTLRVRPRPEPPFEADERVAGPRDVQRLHVVLSPRGKQAYRRLLVGRKRMPETRRQRFWAEIERVCETPAELCEASGGNERSLSLCGSRATPTRWRCSAPQVQVRVAQVHLDLAPAESAAGRR